VATRAQSETLAHGWDLRLVDGHEVLRLIGAIADPDLTVKDLEAIFGTRMPS
jgi:hypothetical protein